MKQSNKIPLIIHQIWIQGCEEVPYKYKKYQKTCKKTNNNFQYYCWNEKNILQLLQKNYPYLIPAYQSFTLKQQKSDLARYLILEEYGGFYLDMDIECGKKPLDTIANLSTIVTMKGGHTPASQSFIGITPHHPLMKQLLKHIEINWEKKWYDFLTVLYVNRTTGGTMFQNYLNQYLDELTIIKNEDVLRCEEFYDCKIKDTHIAMAHFEKSWNPFVYFQQFIIYYKYYFIVLIILLSLLFFQYRNKRFIRR